MPAPVGGRVSARLPLLFLFLLMATLGGVARTAPPIPKNSGWVTDLADFLTDEQERALETLMESYKLGSRQEIALLTVPDMGGQPIERYGLEVARAWGIGEKERHNGALLLVARAERKMRIEVGRGLEGNLTDLVAGRIIRDVVAPEFKRNRFYEGLRGGIEAMHAAAGGDYAKLPARARKSRPSSGLIGLLPLIFFVWLVISLFRHGRGRGGRGRGGRGRGGASDLMTLLLLGALSGRGGRSSGWHGGRSSGGGGGGGFGGFGGGGGFSGGGASGRLVMDGRWTAAGEQATLGFWYLVGLAGPTLFAVILAVLVVRALVRQRRYRVAAIFSQADRVAVLQALTAAEKRTVGEILPVVIERSDPHPGADWLSALCFLIVGTSLSAAWLPWSHPALIIAIQCALGAAGFGLARLLPDFKRLFIFEDHATAVAQEQAHQEFYAAGLHKTEAATGVLIFVSLLERRVILLADEGIDTKVDADFWATTDDVMLDGIRRGSLAEGLVAGIHRAGEQLARHYPWHAGDRDEVPNRLIVRRE